MITVTIFRKENQITGIKSIGHAGYADYGQDIVCAAVSVLLINTMNSIEKFTDEQVTMADAKPGDLEVSFPKGLGHDGKLFIDSLLLGLQEISKEYGDEYLTLIFKEV
ncbi:MAG: ribosomal-processing cysteine protease Prp [Lachnospiraceae bacterium]|nr:ribosomal-processing cysteine protease Prp [Lachnospiraceae bacterium]